ncbi:hypothetical protein MMC08_007188, partial [Hypocenomyce scalaris]|nr:hypothetical protein [Hypocenomyce scalaris]
MQLPWFSHAPVQRTVPAVQDTTNQPLDRKMAVSTPSANHTTSTSTSRPNPVPPTDPNILTPQETLDPEYRFADLYISPYESPAPYQPPAPTPGFISGMGLAPPPSISAPGPTTTVSTSNSTPTFTPPSFAALSASTTALLARVDNTAISAGWEAAREQILSQMTTSRDLGVGSGSPTATNITGGRRGRGVKANRVTSPAARGTIKVERVGKRGGGGGDEVVVKIEPGSTPVPGRSRGRGRGRSGGRPRGSGRGGRGGKRKRSDSDAEDDNKDDTSASETYTPLPTSSRSGRLLHKPAPFTPVVPSTTASPLTAKKWKRPYRRPGEASVCKNCGRGHSPSSNVIVFCDGCNTPWHQHCHDPPIPAEVVMEEEREWICGGCGVLREERVQLEGKVGGEGLGVEEVNIGCLLGNGGADKGLQKRRYFMSLPHAHLVSLLLHASDLTPELPLFAPDARAAAKSSRVGEERPDRAANDEVVDLASPTADELEYEDILPYPKAGNGIPLPPESEDLEFLIDDD